MKTTLNSTYGEVSTLYERRYWKDWKLVWMFVSREDNIMLKTFYIYEDAWRPDWWYYILPFTSFPKRKLIREKVITRISK